MFKITEEQNNNKKAAQFYTLAAQLTQSDSKLWEKIGYLYKYEFKNFSNRSKGCCLL